jgi:hypothetical protein
MTIDSLCNSFWMGVTPYGPGDAIGNPSELRMGTLPEPDESVVGQRTGRIGLGSENALCMMPTPDSDNDAV